MIIKNLKADLSEAAEEKMKSAIEQAVEKKIQKETKKLAKKLTIKIIVTGVALLGAFTVINKADKIAGLLPCSKKR